MISVSTLLLACAIALIAYLTLYALLSLWIILCHRGKWPAFSGKKLPQGEITILVPSHHEGEGLLSCLDSLLAQNYSGKIFLWLLVSDAADSSIALLKKKYPQARELDQSLLLLQNNTCEARILYTGVQSKRDKLNWALSRITSPWLAILDADHRASADWIQSSLTILQNAEPKTIGVQSKRSPFPISRLPQLWDSAQNHLGNEAVNSFFANHQLPVFFTGTTCVFHKEAFQEEGFPDCITEDTNLSYRFLSSGKEISYNPHSGSAEEVAPDFSSYIARRRRWSSGHTQTFFHYLTRIFRAPISFRHKLQMLLHGQFYLIPLASAALIACISLFSFLQFSRDLQYSTLLLSAVFSILLAIALSKKRNALFDWIPGLLCFFPLATQLLVFFTRWRRPEFYQFLLVFPYAKRLGYLQLPLLFLPILLLLLLAISQKGFFKKREIFVLALSYPFFLFLDIYAALLGFFDYAFQQNVWNKIQRENSEMRKVSAIHWPRILVFTASIPALLFLLLLAHDYGSSLNCGETHPWLGRQFLFSFRSPISLESSIQQQILDKDHLRSTLQIAIQQNGTPRDLQLEIRLEGELKGKYAVTKNPFLTSLDFQQELGWDEKKLEISLRGMPAYSCAQVRSLSSSVHEFRGRQFFINGEAFLIKGVIPNFAAPRVNLPLQMGLEQIKALGANAVRLYHRQSLEFYQAAAKLGLLVVDQPDQSTWDNVRPDSPRDIRRLVRSYKELQQDFAGKSFVLFHSLGNELELLHDRDSTIRVVKEMLEETRKSAHESPISYSTYFMYINYPVDVLGINMLDTGPIYWQDALQVISSFAKPFYASEYGGFVAHFENTPTELRLYRMREQWRILQKAGALGAIFFQSHDNWAQPIVEGYNDPFQPDMPDDLRGLWTEKNEPKPELHVLEDIYADLEVQKKSDALKIQNIRDYELANIELRAGTTKITVGNLAPRASRILPLPREFPRQEKLYAFYTSHHGLPGRSVISLNPLPQKNPYLDVADLGWSRDRQYWLSEFPAFALEGTLFVRFKIPSRIPKQTILLWAGLGSSAIQVGGLSLNCQAYRECLIDPAKLQAEPDGYIYARLSRDSLTYLNLQDHPQGALKIRLEKPKLFLPTEK